MRIMHNKHDVHASREITSACFESPWLRLLRLPRKSITAAASPSFLSQPAVSRALQRARAMFQDGLLVRSPNGFELTLRGRKILDELEGLLPRMENLVAAALFDPIREKSHFRIAEPSFLTKTANADRLAASLIPVAGALGQKCTFKETVLGFFLMTRHGRTCLHAQTRVT